MRGLHGDYHAQFLYDFLGCGDSHLPNGYVDLGFYLGHGNVESHYEQCYSGLEDDSHPLGLVYQRHEFGSQIVLHRPRG